MSLLIKNVLFPDHTKQDLYIEGNKIHTIGLELQQEADKIIDGTGKAIIPGFVNGHTHAAMTLFRGFADDMPLMPWLQEKIWPHEAKLTREDIYWGSKLACLEMIKSGTTTFSDMYYHPDITAKVVEEMGLRAFLGLTCFDHFNPEIRKSCQQDIQQQLAGVTTDSGRIQLTLAPHAIYTVSGEFLQWIDRLSAERNIWIHIHVAETEEEVNNAIRTFGVSPVRYLDKLGVLSSRMLMAHGIYIDEEEIAMLADRDVKIIHNPASNMKLASGIEFKFSEMEAAGVTVGLGTDGCSSSNNLDMVEAMKLASLLGKAWRKNPEAIPAEAIFRSATESGARLLGLPAGKLVPGYLADLVLVDLCQPAFVPNFNFISNLVYAANGSCVDTVIFDGKVIMENKQVPGEKEILEQAAAVAYNLMKR
ncbi:MAG: amidohydrolase [Tannerellaceae bacterium]|nr:amidohydrolase [Tannerellaceae bacterium]